MVLAELFDGFVDLVHVRFLDEGGLFLFFDLLAAVGLFEFGWLVIELAMNLLDDLDEAGFGIPVDKALVDHTHLVVKELVHDFSLNDLTNWCLIRVLSW